MRVHVEVHGCAVTQAEGATLRALVSEAGHEVVDTVDAADAVALVTCTVVDRTERDMARRMREIGASARTLVVTGCMASAQAERILEAAPHALVLPPQHVSQIVPLIEEGRFTPAPVDKAGLPRLLDGGLATIVVNDGCLSNCAFCITKRARPGLRSYPVESITQAVADAARAGAVEVRLTSMDTGAYGRDVGTDLPALLRSVADVPGDHQVRLGMLNPFLGVPFLDDLLDVMRHDRFFRFLHVPVQSGSDRVLTDMGRLHTADDFARITRRARDVLGAGATIATDVIAGYPTEGEDDHAATLRLLEHARPTLVNVTRFSPRPGTAAAELKPITGSVVKRRSRELSDVRHAITVAAHEALLGRDVECVVTEHVKAGTSQARTREYVPVVVDGTYATGTRLRVRVTGAVFPHVSGVVERAEGPRPPRLTPRPASS